MNTQLLLHQVQQFLSPVFSKRQEGTLSQVFATSTYRWHFHESGLMSCAHPRYEADDLIGTLVVDGREEGRPSTIVTRDKDLAQLLTKDDVFWDFAGKGKLKYDQIPENFGVWPEQIADFLALAGDSVDNIKGVPGVGKKTAGALLAHFGSLEDIYSNLDTVHEVNVRGAKTLAAKLDAHKEDALLARRLTGIALIPGRISSEKTRRKYSRLLKGDPRAWRATDWSAEYVPAGISSGRQEPCDL